MKSILGCFLGIAALSMGSCGKPDATGFYDATADHRVTLIQTIQTPGGKLTGRVQVQVELNRQSALIRQIGD